MATEKEEKYWIDEVADAVEAFAASTHPKQKTIISASGVTPSGGIHLGNLREAMTSHLISEELVRRGRTAEHLYSWDNYDRFRKVPQDIPADYERYIGMPVSEIPDPKGQYPSYADRYMHEFEESARELGMAPRYIRQAEAYMRGDYTEGIRTAMRARMEIFEILVAHQTPGRHEDDLGTRRDAYYPFKPYCSVCKKDTTTVTSYDDANATLSCTCVCGHKETYSLLEKTQGKLVWKVDWPMRWAHEHVIFEPAGEDHASSSYKVGKEIVQLFGWTAPYFIEYKFVGMAGRSKISSSAGHVPLPRQALDILEAPIVRWLYIRRPNNRPFNIDFGKEVVRLYDEWDVFVADVQAGTASDADKRTYERCIVTSAGPVTHTKRVVPFRLLASTADLTQGNMEQMLRLVREELNDATIALDDLEPRISCAIHWALDYVPEDERTHVRNVFDAPTFQALPEEHKKGITTLLAEMGSNWNVEGLTHLLYGIPKQLLGMPTDAAPTPELKKLQRGFFVSLYQLLVAKETGPRLPTLFLSIGKERVKELLSVV